MDNVKIQITETPEVVTIKVYGYPYNLTKAFIDALGINAATVNSKTVETSVPAGAVFTDTVPTNANIATVINASTADTAVEDTDYFPTVLNATSILKRFSWAYVKSTLKTYFDTLYGALASANAWSAFQKFSEGINIITGKFGYIATSATADAVTDIRLKNNSGSLSVESCTVLNATKGGGTWKTGKLKGRLERTISSTTSAASITPDTDTYDTYKLTAQAAALSIVNPTGSAYDMQELLIYIKDNGTARALSFGTIYSGIMSALPTTTTAGKQMILYFVYNSTTVKWELINKAMGV